MKKFHVGVIIAVISTLCFVSINSAFADDYKLNTVFIIGGVVFAVWAVAIWIQLAGSNPKDSK
jgi:hypothetical protein